MLTVHNCHKWSCCLLKHMVLFGSFWYDHQDLSPYSLSDIINKAKDEQTKIRRLIDMIASRSCCRFVGCTSMMRISRSTTSQRCSIGLISGDCGGHLSNVNSLSCSRNQSEMIWALWPWCIILLEVVIRRWVHCSHEGMDMVSNHTQVGCGVK